MAHVTWPRGIPCGIKGHKTGLHSIQARKSLIRGIVNVLHVSLMSLLLLFQLLQDALLVYRRPCGADQTHSQSLGIFPEDCIAVVR
jgi:hypothetical protein